jgi:hypothetical protein
LRKLDKQQEIVILLAKPSTMILVVFWKQHVNAEIINLIIKIARFKFKKLGEVNYNLWIMLVKPTSRKSYLYLHVIIL